MRSAIRIIRAAPLTTIQDEGRFGGLRHGIGASGPMDATGFASAGAGLAEPGAAIEFTHAGIAFEIEGAAVTAGFGGGVFGLSVNGNPARWGARLGLRDGDRVDVVPGKSGNYGYVRFSGELAVPALLGSQATNLVVGLGGFRGRALRVGDAIEVIGSPDPSPGRDGLAPAAGDGPIRVIWGLHADLFAADMRRRFLAGTFRISQKMDRMGVRLDDPGGVFAVARILSLVSDAVVPGDIQILGDGTPIVLMRDHQPTGGYPRIATVISADIDRFAQMRAGSEVTFLSVSVDHAHALLRRSGK